MKRRKMESVGLYFCLCVFIALFYTASGIHLTKSENTYAKFPKWNACTNGSFSFEFRTTQQDGMLMYTDDNGNYDYVEVLLVYGAVRLRMNIVDGKDGSIAMTDGTELNDNRWHKVEIQRNRMETTLFVDGRSQSQVAFGSDFHFGELSRNNFVYFGGLPKSYMQNLKALSLPSVMFVPRLGGEIRNVIYGNCTCAPVRGVMLEGVSVSRDPREACEINNQCGNCLCVSLDNEARCQCVSRTCAADDQSYYYLPMDEVRGTNLVNPSGLDANVTGTPIVVPGVVGSALWIDGRTTQITVSGPGHRFECFGDLSRCHKGYTMALWVKFAEPGTTEHVYLSNGGHSSMSHGVAMLYKVGTLGFVFRMKSGKEWHVKADNILPRRWYHVTTSWIEEDGLTVFINGEKVAQDDTFSFKENPSRDIVHNEFVIGRANDATGTRDMGTMVIDEFQFWSTKKTEMEVREEGAVYQYKLSMDKMRNGQLIVPNLEPRTVGQVQQVPGKIGNAISFNGRIGHIDLGQFGDFCLGNTTLCKYGLMVSMWISFRSLRDNTYYIASGLQGFTMFSYGNRLYTKVQRDDRLWQAVVSGIETGQWYFVEISWTRLGGLSVYLDQELRASEPNSNHGIAGHTRNDNFYIGQANALMRYERYADAVIDELEMFNADRDTLLFLDFIQRGKPQKYHYGFDVMTGNRISHPTTLIQAIGRPILVSGKIGKALFLDGRQLAEFDNGDDCLGNLDYCNHGAMLALWFKADTFEEGMHYLSSATNGFTMSYVDRKLRVVALTTTQKWEVTTPVLEAKRWYFLELSWDPDVGLKLYSNGQFLDEDTNPIEHPGDPDELSFPRDQFRLGSGNWNKRGMVNGSATFDELEYWYGPRSYLLAFGYIQRGKPTNYLIGMDKIQDRGGRLVHPSLPVALHGYPVLVGGKVGNALKLNGAAQTLSLGDQTDKCLGNLQKCTHGITISAWMRIDDYDTNMYILSTGRDGIRMYYSDGYIYLTLDSSGKSWRASIPRLPEQTWHYVEMSWHPEFGLNFYVDNELKYHAGYRNVLGHSGQGTRDFIVGGPNSGDTPGQRFSYADMAIDEMEIWYGRREELLAFDYIIRDDVEHESFSMETATNGILDHPRFTVTLAGGANLVKGKVGNAVSLNGRGQFVDVGQHMDICLANLDRCNHGITMSMWLNARALRDNTYFLSSPTYSLFYKDGQLRSRFSAAGKAWNVATNKFKGNTWHNVMLSWEPENGLVMYLDGDVVGKGETPTELLQGDQPRAGNLYIGKASSDDPRANTANAIVDEVQYWYANIERLRTHGLYGGNIHESIPLSQFDTTGVMRLPSRTVVLKGGATRVRGQHAGAIQLNGKGQYIDLGENLTCGGNLDRCRQGFTMRFSLKPEKLVNNMYLVDSYPTSIFYRDGKLYATVRTPTKSWTVAAPGFTTGEWQVVDVSWHPETGLTMYLNDEEVGAHKTYGTDHDEPEDIEYKTYIGRSLGDMKNKRFANAIFDNFEVWNVRRDVLFSAPDARLFPTTTLAPPVSVLPPLGDVSTSPPNDAGADDVFVTSFPGVSSQLRPVLSGSTSQATSNIIRFYGNSYVRYDFNVLTPEMLRSKPRESISFQFITLDSDGLMWFFESANGQKIHISMQNGELRFVVDYGSTLPQQVKIVPRDGRKLNDFSWHTIKVEKENRTLKFILDQDEVTQITLRRDVDFVTRGYLYLGGTLNTNTDTEGLIRSNFDGAVTDVETRKFTRPERELIISFLQFVDRATGGGDYEVINKTIWDGGNWTWTRTTSAPPTTRRPPEVPSTVKFTSGSSVFFLRDALDMRPSGSSISFRFRTPEPRGLLALARQSPQASNFIAIEVFDGLLYFTYKLGSADSQKLFADRRVDDGEWHDVKVTVQGETVVLSLDGREMPLTLRNNVDRMHFYRLYIGGFDDFNRIPWSVYSRGGYKGCLESLKVNGAGVNLHSRFRDANIRGVELGCSAMPSLCQQQPCDRGYCRNRLNGFVCDCSSTTYTGQTCSNEAVIASWDGTYSSDFEFNRRQVRHTNDISFRFMTPLKDTVLFRTEVDINDDYMQAELVDGRVKVTINVDGNTQTFETFDKVNDYFWHTLYIRRRANKMEVWVDNNAKSVSIIDGKDYQMNIDRIRFGALGTGPSTTGNYIGYMQNFMYEDRELFSELRRQSTNVVWLTNVAPDNLPMITYNPVTITSSGTYFKLPPLPSGRTMKLLFKFRTREPDGLIMYNRGAGNDAFAVEMHNGYLQIAYNMGGRKQIIRFDGKRLDDNAWHAVLISVNEQGHFYVNVDNLVKDVTSTSGDRRLDLVGDLYVAGLPSDMFQQSVVTSLIQSRKGFRGCLASMDLNGAVPELLNYAPEPQYILNECTDLAFTCKPGVCGRGECIAGVNDYTCNCDMTGFTGKSCSEEPIGHYFGKNGQKGMLLYQFPTRRVTDSSTDNIAFGFMSREKDGVLMRLESITGQEFIEIRLEDGFVVAESKTGTGHTVDVRQDNRQFDDGAYHVVRYTRTESDTSLQVDDWPVKNIAHSGGASLFNNVYLVTVGGRRLPNNAISGNFNGIIGGSHWNGQRWQDLAFNGKGLHGNLVQMKGDVVITRNPFLLVREGIACQPGVCGRGVCVPGVSDYTCNCDMTGYIGTACSEEPIGHYFGKNNQTGMLLYQFPTQHVTGSSTDNIAFGFKSYAKDGVLMRLESVNGREFIEIRLENGFVVAETKTGTGQTIDIRQDNHKVDDGAYHVVRYIRSGTGTSLQVDNLAARTVAHSGGSSLFRNVYLVTIGGRRLSNNAMSGNFYGIIGGSHWNTHRWQDMFVAGKGLHGSFVQKRGDVVLTKPFILIKGGGGGGGTGGGGDGGGIIGGGGGTSVTAAPIFIPPNVVIPDAVGGGGFVGTGISGGGGGPGPGPDIVAIGGPGTFTGGVGIFAPGEPVSAAVASAGPAPPPFLTGARAGAVVGTLIGTMAFLSSLMWALYKLKPGVPACLSPGAASAGGGAGGTSMSISPPRATSNLAAVQAASAGGGSGAGGGGATKLTVVNGTAAGGEGGGGGGSSTFTSYFQSTSTSVSGGGAGGGAGAGAGGTATAGGVDAFDSATLRATGTFSNKGTTIGTPKAVRANLGSSSSAYSANYQQNSATMSGYGTGDSAGMGYGSASLDRGAYLGGGGANIPDYDIATGTGTLQGGHSYSTSTLNTNYNYQVLGISNLDALNAQHHTSSFLHPGARYTSVASILLPHASIHPYTIADLPSEHQAFVERKQDYMVVNPRRILIVVKPVVGVGAGGGAGSSAGETARVDLHHTLGPSSFVSYKASSADASNYGYSTIGSTKSSHNARFVDKSTPVVEVPRKASLQVTPVAGQGRTDHYESLDSFLSEGNMDTCSSTSNLLVTRKSKTPKHYDQSTDHIYESTSTLTSTLRSIDHSLDSLDDTCKEDKAAFSSTAVLAFEDSRPTGYPRIQSTSSQQDYATVIKTEPSKKGQLSEVSIELTDLGAPPMQTGGATSQFLTQFSESTETSDYDRIFSPTSGSHTETSLSFDWSDIQFKLPGAESEPPSGAHTDRAEVVVEESKSSVVRSKPSLDIGPVGGRAGFDSSQELDKRMLDLMSSLDMDTEGGSWETGMMVTTGDSEPVDDWEVQNLKTVMMNRQGQYVLTSGSTSGAVTPGAAADEVRVDCCLMTKDGRSVVTGSSAGPPQVWDMQNGELLRIMKGDTIGSTNLHLVCGDRLLVGAVHADMEINEYSGRKGVFNHTLQIWDFVTGKPLSMAEGEYCSALCPMSDNDKVLFGRTDKFGDATSILAWDLMGNQPIKEMRYDAPVGNNDYVNYLAMSKNDRYVVAGFSNSFDNYTEFMVFDMTLTSYNVNEPNMLKLDANSDCTAILQNDEAVTGLRNGDLVIWSLRTGQPSRQLLAGGGAHAHTREVKAVALSDDGRYLVSASADGTLKVWDMNTERPVHTLSGHTDEVWCCSISPDNEIIVSGSNDGTIRLWRLRHGNEMCVFNTGVDIFQVTMSHDKGTIVALGDKYGARKLIMLQVVRTKIKKVVSS